MIYLFLYVVFSSIFGLCIKWVLNRGKEDVVVVGAINYIVAALMSLPWVLLDQNQTGNLAAMITGGSMGIIYFIAFFFCFYCIRIVGVSATAVVSSLSLLLPIVVAAQVWGSLPNSMQIFGIGLATLSLILVGVKRAKSDEVALGENATTAAKSTGGDSIGTFGVLILLGFFLLCGCSRVAQEAFNYESQESQKPTFLLSAFALASIPSLYILAKRRFKVLPAELGIGLVVGVSNGVQTFFILMSLQNIPGYIVFPVTSAGSILLTTAVATLFLHEKLSKQAWIGIMVAVVAMILLNWRPE